MTDRLATALGRLLERRVSRRSALSRAALAGSAFAVAPLRYLLRPGTAWAVISPGSCPGSSLCNDGYTAFCCSVNNGSNYCPPNTVMGGWWKADNSSFCGGGPRYYMDCNASCACGSGTYCSGVCATSSGMPN